MICKFLHSDLKFGGIFQNLDAAKESFLPEDERQILVNRLKQDYQKQIVEGDQVVFALDWSQGWTRQPGYRHTHTVQRVAEIRLGIGDRQRLSNITTTPPQKKKKEKKKHAHQISQITDKAAVKVK